MNLESKVLKLEECYYEFDDTLPQPQHYNLDKEMANYFDQNFSSVSHSSKDHKSQDFSLSTHTFHIQFQNLVD